MKLSSFSIFYQFLIFLWQRDDFFFFVSSKIKFQAISIFLVKVAISFKFLKISDNVAALFLTKRSAIHWQEVCCQIRSINSLESLSNHDDTKNSIFFQFSPSIYQLQYFFSFIEINSIFCCTGLSVIGLINPD